MADPTVPVTESSAKPTRKWWATQVTAVAALAVMYFTTGGWDVEESVAAVGVVSQALIGYLVPNDPTVGGVPPKSV